MFVGFYSDAESVGVKDVAHLFLDVFSVPSCGVSGGKSVASVSRKKENTTNGKTPQPSSTGFGLQVTNTTPPSSAST